MIFDLMMDESMLVDETRDIANTIETLFDKLGVDPIAYEWILFNIEDYEEARAVGLRNLFQAAQDINMLPDVLDIDDFDFNEDIILKVKYYSEEDIEEISSAVQELEKLLELEIKVDRE